MKPPRSNLLLYISCVLVADSSAILQLEPINLIKIIWIRNKCSKLWPPHGDFPPELKGLSGDKSNRY